MFYVLNLFSFLISDYFPAVLLHLRGALGVVLICVSSVIPPVQRSCIYSSSHGNCDMRRDSPSPASRLLAHTQFGKPGSDPEPGQKESPAVHTYDFISCVWRCQFVTTFLSSRQEIKANLQYCDPTGFKLLNWSS